MSEADEMIRQAKARRGKRWPFVVVVLVLFSLPFLFIGYSYWAKQRAEHRLDLDADGRKELAQQLVDAESEIAKREVAYRAAVTREKLSTIEPTDARCPIDSSSSFAVTRPNAPIPVGDTIQRLSGRVNVLRKTLGEGRATVEDLRSAKAIASNGAPKDASKDSWSGVADTVLLADEIVEARMTRDPDTMRIGFVSGRVAGRAYAYSYDDSRIVCAGRVEGRSSATIEVKYQSTSISPTLEDPGTFLARTEAEKNKLWEDLLSQTRSAAMTSLRVVP